jgi:heptosyltransferase-3
MMYWSARRDFRVIPHLVAIFADFCRIYLTLLIWKKVRGRRRILMIGQIEYMGDIVAAEPLSRVARLKYPASSIVWAARKPFRELVACFPAVDHVVVVRCLTEWMLLRSSGLGEIIWDLHIAGHICPKCSAALVKAGSASAITYKTYYDFGNLQTIQCLSAGIPAVDDAPVLPPDDAARSEVDALGLPRRFVVLHCTSNDRARDWSQAKWNQLAEYIANSCGLPIIEIGLRSVVAESREGQSRSLCGQLSILETAEVIRRAALFVGLDSGPAHLANAVGTPGVILLGKFHSWQNHMPYSGPYQTGFGADLIRTPGPLVDLPVEAVTRAVSLRLDKTTPKS